jgi:hypothetical protein
MHGWLILPWAVQGTLILCDEAIMHRKREIPRWERIGHPLDTLTVLACFAVILLREPTLGSLQLYAGLAIFSCLFVTKDEWVHAARCTPGEHWLHSMLFILHPICLGAAGVAWWHGELGLFLRIEAGLISAFLLYQIAYWLRARGSTSSR